MIILRPGTPPTTDPEKWWVGKEIECGNCNGALRLEIADAPRIQAIYERNGTVRMVALKCPTVGCDKPMKLEETLAQGEWTKSVLAQSRSQPQQ